MPVCQVRGEFRAPCGNIGPQPPFLPRSVKASVSGGRHRCRGRPSGPQKLRRGRRASKPRGCRRADMSRISGGRRRRGDLGGPRRGIDRIRRPDLAARRRRSTRSLRTPSRLRRDRTLARAFSWRSRPSRRCLQGSAGPEPGPLRARPTEPAPASGTVLLRRWRAPPPRDRRRGAGSETSRPPGGAPRARQPDPREGRARAAEAGGQRAPARTRSQRDAGRGASNLPSTRRAQAPFPRSARATS